MAGHAHLGFKIEMYIQPCIFVTSLFVLWYIIKIAQRLGGSKQGETFIDSIEEMKTGQVRFSDREHYLDMLNQWAEETGDRDIGE